MQRLGKEQWIELISEYKKSGLTQKEFAARHQVSHNAVQFWLYKLRREADQSRRFLPVSVVASCVSVLATFFIHTARGVSRRPSVVVMQAIEDWECHETTISLGHSRHRLFLPEALVSPRLVVEAGVLRDQAQKMDLAKHDDMVEQFAPKSCRLPKLVPRLDDEPAA